VNVLDQLDELEREATDAPWTFVGGARRSDGHPMEYVMRPHISKDPGEWWQTWGPCIEHEDAALIALSRNHLRALIEVARLADPFASLEAAGRAAILAQIESMPHEALTGAEIGDWRLEVGNWKLEAGSSKFEVRSWKLEVRPPTSNL